MVRKVKRYWRRFYRTHREGCDLAGDFIGALSVFGSLYCMYMVMWMLGGN